MDTAALRAPLAARQLRAPLFALTAASGLALAALAPIQAGATAFSGSGCAQVNIIVARASTEAQGQGITGNLASQVQSSSAQTVSTQAVVYPATLNNYASSRHHQQRVVPTQQHAASGADQLRRRHQHPQLV